MISIGAGFSPFSIVMLGGRDATKEVARYLKSGRNYNLHMITDSLWANPMNQFLLQSCPSVAWAGCREDSNTTTSNVSATTGFGTGMLNDARSILVSPYYQDQVSPAGRHVAATFVPGTAPTGTLENSYLFRFVWQEITYPIAYSRAVSAMGNALVLGIAVGLDSGGQDQIQSYQRYGVSDLRAGNIVNATTQGVHVFSKNISPFAIGPAAIGLSVIPGKIKTAGVIGCELMIYRACDGVTVLGWGVGGRTTDGWNDDILFSESHRQLLNEIDIKMEADPIYMIDLGRNWKVGSTLESHISKMLSIIGKIKISTPHAKILITNSYPAATDTPGIDPDWVKAAPIIARSVGAAFFDFYHAVMPYAQANALGYMNADGVHYNNTGKAYQASVFSNLVDQYAA